MRTNLTAVEAAAIHPRVIRAGVLEFRKEDRSVDVYVRKVRRKLEEALPGWRFIHTHFGFGYRFAPEEDDGRD